MASIDQGPTNRREGMDTKAGETSRLPLGGIGDKLPQPSVVQIGGQPSQTPRHVLPHFPVGGIRKGAEEMVATGTSNPASHHPSSSFTSAVSSFSADSSGPTGPHHVPPAPHDLPPAPQQPPQAPEQQPPQAPEQQPPQAPEQQPPAPPPPAPQPPAPLYQVVLKEFLESICTYSGYSCIVLPVLVSCVSFISLVFFANMIKKLNYNARFAFEFGGFCLLIPFLFCFPLHYRQKLGVKIYNLIVFVLGSCSVGAASEMGVALYTLITQSHYQRRG